MENTPENTTITPSKPEGMVHFILSHSYSVFLFAVVLGVIIDIIIPITAFATIGYQYAGLGMIFLGSMLIYWAQSTSGRTKTDLDEKGEVRNFACGPYKYSRNPTHIGLTVMTLGLGFIIQSLFSVILIIIAALITKFIFVKKEEEILEKKYGQSYCDYKKKVRTWV